jgi:hypothetical protein
MLGLWTLFPCADLMAHLRPDWLLYTEVLGVTCNFVSKV